MLNNLSFLENSKITISEILNNKILIFYILIGMFIVYILFNILTSTIKYPIIIIFGIIIGKYLYNHYV